MIFHRNSACQPRRGAAIPYFVILLPFLIGWVGLVIDTGLLLAAYRQTQNAADAAAMAGAMELLRHMQDPNAPWDVPGVGQAYATLNSPNATLPIPINNPPQNGPYAGNGLYVEAIVTTPVVTFFIQVLGINPNQQVVARAVAGLEPFQQPNVLIVLDPAGRPGLDASGGGSIVVHGSVVVNAEADVAASAGSQTGKSTGVYATSMSVVGGVDKPDAFYLWNPQLNQVPLGDQLKTYQMPVPDPLATLATPTKGNGVLVQYPNAAYPDPTVTPPTGGPAQDVSVTVPKNQTDKVYLLPGIYKSISISGGTGNTGTVVLSPGIYVLTTDNPNALVINNTGGKVTGDGVMFYITGSSYNAYTGAPDNGDGNNPVPKGTRAGGGVTINSQNLTLSGLNDAASVFDGMLFYFRRWNTTPFNVGAAGVTVTLNGTFYDKWGLAKIAGQGTTFNSPFVIGTIQVTGGAILDAINPIKAKSYEVYLVE